MKLSRNRYFLAALVGIILGLFGAAQQYVQIIATTNKDLASVLGALLLGIALFVDILPKPNQIINQPPQITVDHVTNMPTTVNAAPTDPPPPPAIAAVTRNPHGQFAKRVTPVDPLSDH